MRSSRAKIEAGPGKKALPGRTSGPECADKCRLRRLAPPSSRHNAPHEPADNQFYEVAPLPIKQQEVWTSTEELFWDHMREVQNKWSTLKLNDDIWAKLIYFEQNRRLAKAYVSTPVLTIDGSTNGLDGFRIGLSGIENSYRNLDSVACLRTIGHGIKLQIDEQGNILIKRLAPQSDGATPGGASQCSVWVKEWPSCLPPSVVDGAGATGQRPQQLHNIHSSLTSFSSSSASSSSTASSSSDYSHLSPYAAPASSSPSDHYHWPTQEIIVSRSPYKLFDMQKFRAQLERQNRLGPKRMQTSSETLIDWRQCVSIISFVRSGPPSAPSAPRATAPTTTTTPNGRPLNGTSAASGTLGDRSQLILDEPCWLMLINIIAIDMLKSSICDNNSFNYSGPQSQMSALVDRCRQHDPMADNYRQAHDSRRGASRQRTPEHEHNRDQYQSAKGLNKQHQLAGLPSASFGLAKDQHHLRNSASALSLYPAEMEQQQPPVDLDKASGHQLQLAANSMASSGRLKRLSNFNTRADQRQTSRNTSISGTSKPLSSGPFSAAAAAAAAAAVRFNPSLDANSFIAANPTSCGCFANSSHSSSAIYTTLTGKCMDRQQRQRRLLNASSDNLQTKQEVAAGSDQLATALRPVDLNPFMKRHGRARTQLDMDSRRNGSPDAVPARVRAGLGRIPFVKESSLVGHNQLLSHSLSASDLSHLKSLKSSSIKMNFDNVDEYSQADDDVNCDCFCDCYCDCLCDCKENCDEDEASQIHLQARPRWILHAVDSETLEWADLAKKFSLDRNDLHSYAIPMIDGHELRTKNQNDQDDGIQQSSSTISSNGMSEVGDMDGIGLARPGDQNDADADHVHPTKQQQAHKRVSRCSLASAASLSSGCADNEYFVSPSSSSTSFSIRTSEGGGASQPASSSGITSDDYGQQQDKHNLGKLSADFDEQEQDVSTRTTDRRGAVKYIL